MQVDEFRCKSLPQNISKKNPATYKNNNKSGPSEVCPSNTKLV